jgi:hypothetical protein
MRLPDGAAFLVSAFIVVASVARAEVESEFQCSRASFE